MTLTLVIETSTERGAIGLVDVSRGKVLAQDLLPFGYQNSRFLLPRLQTLFGEVSCTPQELAFITVGNGPGSYTGMRVGAVVAKTLSYACGVPLVGVSSLASFVPQENCIFAALVDAKISGAYVMLGSMQGGDIVQQEPEVCRWENLPAKLNNVATIVSPHARPASKMPLTSIHWEETSPNVAHLAALGSVRWQSEHYTTDGSLTFLYLRKTQAEIERAQNSGNGQST